MKNEKAMKIMLVVAIVFFLVMVGLGFFNIVKNREQLPENPNKQISNEIGDTSEETSLIIDKTHVPQNKEKLEEFLAKIQEDENATLRVELETPDSLYSVLDINSSGDVFVVTQDDTQISGDIQENIYEEYSIKEEVITIEDGLKLQSYYLYNEALENKIELFAFLSEIDIISGDILNETIESGE